MGTANTVQSRFWHRQDNGDETSATFRGAINSSWSPSLSDLDTPQRLRIEAANTGSKNEDSGSYALYVSKNSGSYTAMGTASGSGIRLIASGTVTDGVFTTEQMSGSQPFVSGWFDSNGTVAAMVLPASGDSEFEYCYQLDTADLQSGDTFDFQIYRSGSPLDGYTNIPRITIPTLPSGEIQQSDFRIRAAGNVGDSVGLNVNSNWAADLNTNAVVQPHVSRLGATFRARITLEEINGLGKTITPRVYAQKNGAGGYSLLPTFPLDSPSGFTKPQISIVPSAQFADGTATTEVLAASAKAFTAGYGIEDNSAGNITLNNQSTEIEFTLHIDTLYSDGVDPQENIDGDYWDIRIYDNTTPLGGTYTTPRITFDTTGTGHIGGVYAEGPNNVGPFADSNGNLYTLVEDTENTAELCMMKSTDGGDTWRIQDNANRPADTDLECIDIFQDGDTLHIVHHPGSAVNYYTFRMSDHGTSPDTWGIEEVVSSISSPAEQSCAISVRSDGDVIIFYNKLGDSAHYKIRTGTWGSEQTLDATAGEDFTGITCVRDNNDRTFIAYTDYTAANTYFKDLDSSDTLSSRTTLTTDARSSGAGSQAATIPPIFWLSGTDRKVAFFYQREQSDTTPHVWMRVITDTGSGYGSPSTETQVTDNVPRDNPIAVNSRQVALTAAVDDSQDNLYALYSQDSDGDVYRAESSDGGAWGTDVEQLDGRDVDHIRGSIFTHSSGNGGKTVFGFITEEQPYVSNSGYSGGVRYDEYELPSGADNLVATGITTTPVLGTPALGQEHDLTATGISITPVVDTPSIGQEHALDATAISTTPVVGNPAISESHVLDATAISTTPVVDTPGLGVIHNLVANDILSVPVLDTPEIGQEHALNVTDISTTPVVGAPELTEGQIHNLVATDISATPVVDTPIIVQKHDLTTSGISASPVVDTPVIGEIHNLDATEISITPVVDTPALGVIHNLNASDITTTPVLDTPSVGQEHDLTASGISTTPVLGNPVLSTEGVHAFTASDLLVIPEVGNPALGQTHILSATGISAAPTVDTPILSAIHNLIATDITTTPVLETPAVGQIHALLANGISSGPVVDTPILVVIHVLTANSIVAIPIVETPQIGQIHVLSSGDILVLPMLETPIIGQTHVLLPNGIITTPELGHPALDIDLIEYPVGMVVSAVYPTAEINSILPTILVSTSMED